MTPARFKKIIKDHYRQHGRKMPWRQTKDPYKILVSEIMLQQTQVGRVEGYYTKFLKRFPDVKSLAHAKTADVLREWQGLGYNRRALNLQKLSKVVLEKFNGHLPRNREVLESLPGIGKGTSGALMAFAFNEPVLFIETNIRRVFIHFFFPKRQKVTDAELERYIKSTVDKENPREWYWALMDYGAFMAANGKDKKRTPNPNQRSAHYKKQSPFSGSNRELRGKVLRLLLAQKKIHIVSLKRSLNAPVVKIQQVIEALCSEGFASKKGNYLSLNAH